MCIRFPRSADPEPQKGPPPITPRVEKDTSVKPKKQELLDPTDKKGVEFGSSKKQGAGITTRARGTEALRIPYNPGGGGNTGGGSGVNV